MQFSFVTFIPKYLNFLKYLVIKFISDLTPQQCEKLKWVVVANARSTSASQMNVNEID
jgi:carbonic anhydrase